MAIDKSQMIELRIRELARNYFLQNRPEAAGIAPILQPVRDAQGLTYEYQFVSAPNAGLVGRLDTLTSETANLTTRALGLGSKSVTLDNIDVGVYPISDSTSDAFFAQVGRNAADVFVELLVSKAYAEHSFSVHDTAAADLDGEVLDVEDGFDSDLKDLMVEILRDCGQRPNTIIMGPADVATLSKQDFVRDFPSVSITSGDKARTGWAGENDVRSYFAGAHGLNLIVDNTGYRPTDENDPREFAWQGRAALGFSSDGFASDTLKTFVQYSGEILRTEVRRNSGVQRIGYSVAAEGVWKVEATAPETGRYLSLDGTSISS